jgi:hypothetical protein
MLVIILGIILSLILGIIIKKGDPMLAKKIALGFGIAIIFPMMIHYGVSTFVSQPKWDDYHVKNYFERYEHGTAEEKIALEAEQNKLDKEYHKKNAIFQKYLFFVSVPLGIIAIVTGSLKWSGLSRQKISFFKVNLPPAFFLYP